MRTKIMNVTTSAPNISSFSSPSPCSQDEIAINPEGCVEGTVAKWLEDETVAGFRVWQLAGIVISIILVVTIALCCCIRFRIPRTKQDIEADYIRKRITKNFRKQLDKISNTDIEEMNLQRALERVRADLEAESEERDKQCDYLFAHSDGLRGRFNAMVHGMRTSLSKNSSSPANRQNSDNDV